MHKVQFIGESIGQMEPCGMTMSMMRYLVQARTERPVKMQRAGHCVRSLAPRSSVYMAPNYIHRLVSSAHK
jgi:hypothetical protein